MQTVDRLTIKLTRQYPASDLNFTNLVEVAEDIRSGLLDSCGYPYKVDFKVEVDAIETLPESELWEIPHAR